MAFEPALEIFGEIVGGGIAGAWVAFEAAGADGFEVAVGDLGKGAEFRGGRLGGLADDGKSVGAEEGRPAGEEVEEDGAEAVDIGGRS